MFNVEVIRLTSQIAQFAEAEHSRIEIGGQVCKLGAYCSQRYLAVLTLSIWAMIFLIIGVAALGDFRGLAAIVVP